MPSGFGVARTVPLSALRGVAVDRQHGNDGLTRSAIQAVVQISRAAGKPVRAGTVAPAPGPTSSSTSPLLTIGVPALVVLAGVLMLSIRRLRRKASPPGAGRD